MDILGNLEDTCPVCQSIVHSYQLTRGVFWVEHHERPWRGRGHPPEATRLCPVGGMPWTYLQELKRAKERKAAAQGRFDTILMAAKKADTTTNPPKHPGTPPPGGERTDNP